MNGFDAPYIDYAGISPLIALTAGTCVTLLAGLFRARALVLVTALATLAAAAGLSAWQFGESKSLVEGALRSDDLSLSLSFVFYAAAAIALLLSLGERGDRPSALGDYAGLMLAERDGNGRARELHQPRVAVRRDRAAVHSAVCDVRARPAPPHVARVGPEVPGDRLDRLRHAAVRARVHLRSQRLDGLRARSRARSATRASPATRCC